MAKMLVLPDQIVAMLNAEMKKSTALDGDCRECLVRRVSRVPDHEAKQLRRNWNVDMVNGECQGDCMEVLQEVAIAVGYEYDVSWP
jgi:hypothetical protein